MTLTQFGLIADIVGFSLLIPNLVQIKKGMIPFPATVGQPAWFRLLIGVVLVILGFSLQLIATF